MSSHELIKYRMLPRLSNYYIGYSSISPVLAFSFTYPNCSRYIRNNYAGHRKEMTYHTACWRKMVIARNLQWKRTLLRDSRIEMLWSAVFISRIITRNDTFPINKIDSWFYHLTSCTETRTEVSNTTDYQIAKVSGFAAHILSRFDVQFQESHMLCSSVGTTQLAHWTSA